MRAVPFAADTELRGVSVLGPEVVFDRQRRRIGSEEICRGQLLEDRRREDNDERFRKQLGRHHDDLRVPLVGSRDEADGHDQRVRILPRRAVPTESLDREGRIAGR